MARRRSRHTGHGMTPLFDLAPLTSTQSATDHRSASAKRVTQESDAPPKAIQVPYQIRGLFRLRGGEEHVRTVEGLAISTRLREDAARFVAYLGGDGWLFPDGRGVLVNVLAVTVHDGTVIPCRNTDVPVVVNLDGGGAHVSD